MFSGLLLIKYEILKLPLFLILMFFLYACQQKEEVIQYAPVESYPKDSTLASLDIKRAMIVTAHDDDICLISGTASKLNRSGWQVIHVFIPNQDKKRNKAHLKAASHVLDSVFYLPLQDKEVRYDLDEVEYSWAAVPRDKFPEIYNYSAVQAALIRMINDFSPSVIFTLDNEIGGYGHPDHVFMSQLVLDLGKEQKITTDYIYQSVMTDHMEKSIIGERHSRRMRSWGYDGEGWNQARAIYRVDGMPEPDVEINISTEAENKMAFLRSYNERERKTLGFFIPAFEDYEAEEYFSIFNREFFRVIKLNSVPDTHN